MIRVSRRRPAPRARPADAWFDEAVRRMHAHPGMLERFSPQEIAAIMAYDGPEAIGPAGPRR
jgi:hypothetical protein